ncbi:Crp/Fnr family transcriptional regulator [Listeria ilorinensis]|uniref:Crp/Fnr family transcriptional regulator n=1 Tax=Listeria ilorinensis TaxID=2867439 RepID=UPI001EF4B62A|nr:Crp/Fnr family transcriptional regulator [Listeria ilorinensis]
MNFLDFHQFVKQDALIYSWVIKNFYLKNRNLMAGETLLATREQVIITKQGLLVQESLGKRSAIERAFCGEHIIFTVGESHLLYALEETVYSIVSADILLDALESNELLPNFFLQVAEELERTLEWKKTLTSVNPKKRISLVLSLIIERYQLNPNSNPAFPKWLKIHLLAKLAQCSLSTASVAINELAKQGKIDIKSTPWLLRENFLHL